jgi:hypothetical protein
MATRVFLNHPSYAVSLLGRPSFFNLLRTLAVLFGFSLCTIPARAQLQQPFVFAVDTNGPGPSILVYTRNDITGMLTPVAGSPFPSRAPVNSLALDFRGRFLFAATSQNNIEMYTIDPNTGALQEVLNSPFASPTTRPEFLSTESSGQFLYVIDRPGPSGPPVSAVESFQIDAVNLSLIPTVAGATDLPGVFIGGATHPSGKAFYVSCNSLSSSPNVPFFLLFNSSSGTFTTPNILPPATSDVVTLALDPQGLHVAVSAQGVVTSQELQLDGTLGPGNVSITVTAGSPDFMSFDTLGQFLYVGVHPTNASSSTVHFYSATSLQELPNSPLAQSFPRFSTWIADPSGPLIYADNVYQVDPQTGLLNSILSPDPLPTPFFGSTVFSKPPGSQPITGPAALLSAMSLSFGSLSVGQPSGPQTLTILSNGGQALSLNSFTFTGANSGDFAITSDTCPVPSALPPGQSCSVLISFTPSGAGNRAAAFTITDNASPAMESVQLNGTGLNPAPAVSLIPASLNFATVTQGTTTSLPISVKNSGTATLHISSVAIAGANANDFSSSSPTCTAPLLANSTCTINVTFTPLAAGLRTATVTLTDDAPDSPQLISVQGNATAAPGSALVVNPNSPDFGTRTQGTSNPMNVTLTNAGTAALHITNAVLGGANASEFTLADPTCNTVIAASSSCTLVLTFAPLSVGAHAATVTLTDDAPGSPQVVNITGMASAAFTPGPAPGGSMSASVSAGQTAQYLLQLNPGAGFSGTVAFACSGAPLRAVCQVPPTVSIANGAPAPFTVTVSTAGTATLPRAIPEHFSPLARVRVLQLIIFVMFLALVARKSKKFDAAFRGRRLACTGAVTVMLLCSVIYAAGCGSTSAVTTTPPPIVTPSGTSTITISMTAMSLTQQPLQLPPIQLTLTVK